MTVKNDIVTNFSMVNTNARSLCPKIRSLLDCFSELNTDLAILTETWLTSGLSLDEDIEDLRLGASVGLLVRNRDPGSAGFSHGGVGDAFRDATCNFRQIPINNPNNYEVLAAIGNIPGQARKAVVLACYMPPDDPAARGNSCIDYIQDFIILMKRKYSNPYLIVSGDFNQWRIENAMDDFADMQEVDVGPTRAGCRIDRTFVSFHEDVQEAGTVLLLKRMTRREDPITSYHTSTYHSKGGLLSSYRFYNKDSEELFGQWAIAHDWNCVIRSTTSNSKEEAYQGEVTDAIARFFHLSPLSGSLAISPG